MAFTIRILSNGPEETQEVGRLIGERAQAGDIFTELLDLVIISSLPHFQLDRHGACRYTDKALALRRAELAL